MDAITKNFTFSHVPPVFKRGQQVMLAIFDRNHRLYLSRKHIYPVDIYRLFGGGVEPNETTAEAASRELREETNLSLPLIHQQSFTFNLTESSTAKQFVYQADLFYTFLQFQPITLGDDVNGMKVFLKSDLNDLLALYRELPTDLVTGKNGDTFRWSDWAQIFGDMSQYVLDHWP